MPILQDRIVLVTGAGAGIGRGIALAMAEAGASVAAADIDLAAAQRTADRAAGNNRRAVAIEADCGDVASIDAMVARASMSNRRIAKSRLGSRGGGHRPPRGRPHRMPEPNGAPIGRGFGPIFFRAQNCGAVSRWVARDRFQCRIAAPITRSASTAIGPSG